MLDDTARIEALARQQQIRQAEQQHPYRDVQQGHEKPVFEQFIHNATRQLDQGPMLSLRDTIRKRFP